MSKESENRFDDFFREPAYLSLKNHLYNYRVRRRAVRERLTPPEDAMVLEVGSGISPISPADARTVFTELSFPALRHLKKQQAGGHYVVADAARLPFKRGIFRAVVCSEVLEHIEDDLGAVGEIVAVLGDGGRLIVTFPHRRAFFAADDRFVGHHRRYDLPEMLGILERSGLRRLSVGKVMGPLEKVTMWIVVSALRLLPSAVWSPTASGRGGLRLPPVFVSLFGLINRMYAALVRLDAHLVPMRFASVVLVVAEKP